MMVKFIWQARLHEQLGYFKFEEIFSPNGYVYFSRQNLYLLNTTIVLLNLVLRDRDKAVHLFQALQDLILSFAQNNWHTSVQLYCLLEIELLKHLGFYMILDKCAKSGSGENLKYISPKTGKAVSIDSAAGYEDRLLKLPRFMKESKAIIETTTEDIRHALQALLFFLQKTFKEQYNMHVPTIRQHLTFANSIK